MKHIPTIDDVARLAGVSTATVSRALNMPEKVRLTTREIVEKAVNQLGYTPNFSGQALASNKTNTVGAIIPTMENAIFSLGLQSLQETLSEAGITLLIATSLYDPKREEVQIRTLLARGVDGLVLIGGDRSGTIYELLQARQIPYVLLWTSKPRGKHVTIGFDNVSAAAALARRVVELGHRRIAMIAGIADGNDRARDRIKGVRSVLAQNNLEFGPDNLVELPYSIDEGEKAACEMLQRDARPTAIMCGNDVLAAGALRAARKCGLAVPGDLSIVGFDDLDLAKAVDPQLTTVRVPHRRMGSAAANCLINWLKTGKKGAGLVFPADIIERESLAPPPG